MTEKQSDKDGGDTMSAQELHAAHALSYFQAILKYTAGFYGAAIEHGMKAGETANAVAHMENAARALYRLATTIPSHVAQKADDEGAADDNAMLYLGGSYETQGGDVVNMVAINNPGSPHETLVDGAGVNRYSRRLGDAGRVTGSAHDYSEPLNIKRPFLVLMLKDVSVPSTTARSGETPRMDAALGKGADWVFAQGCQLERELAVSFKRFDDLQAHYSNELTKLEGASVASATRPSTDGMLLRLIKWAGVENVNQHPLQQELREFLRRTDGGKA